MKNDLPVIQIILFTIGLGIFISWLGYSDVPSIPNIKNQIVIGQEIEKEFISQVKVDVKGQKYVELTIDDSIGPNAFTQTINNLKGLRGQGLPIIMNINTPGGAAQALFDLLAVVRNWDGPIITVNQGKAYSCGAFLYIIGDVRVTGYSSFTFFHGAQITTNEVMNISSVKALLNHLKEFNRVVYRLAEEETNQTEAEMRRTWFNDEREDNMLTADQLEKYGLVDVYYNQFSEVLADEGIQGLLKFRNSDQQDFHSHHRSGLDRILKGLERGLDNFMDHLSDLIPTFTQEA